MNSKLITLIALFFSLFTINSYSQDPNFHIYIAFGQSNLEGQGTIEEIDKKMEDSRFQVFQALDYPELNREKGNLCKKEPNNCNATREYSKCTCYFVKWLYT